MQNNTPFISVIIPCRNERSYIGRCLDSLIEQDYPKDKIEVLVVDGLSGDETREIIRKYNQRYPFIKLLDNPKKFTNFAFNIGIKASRGEIIMMMGAHAGYKKDYISKCIKYSKEYNTDNVGGVIKTLPAEDTLIAKSIAFCLSSFFGAGGSWFRTGSEKPRLVDTVFGGCYKREVFDKIGLFNENLLRSQDIEFNLRLKKAGGKILLVPDIVNYYYPKSNLKDFFIHNFKDGVWAIYPLKFMKAPLRLRHYLPLIFVAGLVSSFILGIFSEFFAIISLLTFFSYFLTALYFSLRIAIRENDLRFLFLMPIAFFSRHFGYGFGSIWGLVKLLI